MSVTRVEITGRELFADGESLGAAGPYELLTGTIHFGVDPGHERNAAIADLKLAPRKPGGSVSFDADLALLKPVDTSKGNRRLLFEVVNRGNKQATVRLNAGAQLPDGRIDPGDGFLMRRGYTLAWCGWQTDVPSAANQMALRAPEALEHGERVRGRLQVEFQPNKSSTTAMLSDRNHRPYPTADLEDESAVLSVRDSDRGARRVVPREQWRFAREEQGSPVPDPGHVYLATGFEAGKLYDLVYTAVGATVIGLGLLGMRDTVSFLRYAAAEHGNPCAGALDRALVIGGSQSGRFIRHFLYLGLNEDEQERLVFDGAIVHIAKHGRGQFNQRFGQPSNNSKWDSAGMFPFASSRLRDPQSGVEDGLLERLQTRNKLPKIFFTNTAKEYWSGGAALTHLDAEQKQDLPFPKGVRGYFYASTQHQAGVLPLTDLAGDGLRARYPLNSVDYRPLLRAALVNLDAWVSEGIEPPPSSVPALRDGTLVAPEAAAGIHATIPGVSLPAEWPLVLRLDFGPDAGAGIMAVPPRVVGEAYPALVSAVDADGNDLAGIRLPDVSVPLATHIGWNLRHPEIGAPNSLLTLQGATLPFARTTAERRQRGDPRSSIEERYTSREGYLQRVRGAAEQLVAQRHLLAEDVEPIVERAKRAWDLLALPPQQAPAAAPAPVAAQALQD